MEVPIAAHEMIDCFLAAHALIGWRIPFRGKICCHREGGGKEKMSSMIGLLGITKQKSKTHVSFKDKRKNIFKRKDNKESYIGTIQNFCCYRINKTRLIICFVVSKRIVYLFK